MSDSELLDAIKVAESQDTLSGNLQQALKILLNSGYGAVGNEWFLYYVIENAESITASGQLINKWTHKRVNELLDTIIGTEGINRTVAGDTDSIYLCLSDVVDKLNINHLSDEHIADKIDEFMVKVLSPQIAKMSDSMCDYMNGMRNMMVWGREAIAPVSIFVRKKGYVMRVIDSEGVRFKEPKIKVVGLESVKSSTPEWARIYLKQCYTSALDNPQTDIHDLVKKIRVNFMDLSTNDIAIPRGVNNLEKYASYDDNIYIKGSPKNVKAALIHNHLVDKYKLSTPKITSGNKIKYIDLKRPNPIHQDVIGFTRFLPKEFDIEQFVDRRAIFDVSFMAPLQIFLDAIKWTPEPVVSLESFFM